MVEMRRIWHFSHLVATMAVAMMMARAMTAAALKPSTMAATALPRDSLFATTVRFASKKAGGSTKNGRDSESKRLGVKKFGGCVHCVVMLHTKNESFGEKAS